MQTAYSPPPSFIHLPTYLNSSSSGDEWASCRCHLGSLMSRRSICSLSASTPPANSTISACVAFISTLSIGESSFVLSYVLSVWPMVMLSLHGPRQKTSQERHSSKLKESLTCCPRCSQDHLKHSFSQMNSCSP